MVEGNANKPDTAGRPTRPTLERRSLPGLGADGSGEPQRRLDVAVPIQATDHSLWVEDLDFRYLWVASAEDDRIRLGASGFECAWSEYSLEFELGRIAAWKVGQNLVHAADRAEAPFDSAFDGSAIPDLEDRFNHTDGDQRYLEGYEVGVPVLGCAHTLDVLTGKPLPEGLRDLDFRYLWVINGASPVGLGASGSGRLRSPYVEFQMGIAGARRLARFLFRAVNATGGA